MEILENMLDGRVNELLYRKRDEALERVISIWEKMEPTNAGELEKALDVLTIAHITATFEYCSDEFGLGLQSKVVAAQALKADEANRRSEPITADDVRRIRQRYFGYLPDELVAGDDD
jgi:hypothetical protein